MTRPNESIDPGGITALFTRMVQGVGRLVTDHLALVRLELGEDARTLGARLGAIALFVPAVLAGYTLVCGALAVVLGGWLTPAGGLVAVGAANLLAGGLGLSRALARLRLPAQVDERVEATAARALVSVQTTVSTIRDSIDRRVSAASGASP